MNKNRVFPDILAVDPENCGCTECIIGEYVPLQDYLERANAYDLVAIIEGEVRLNTSDNVLDFILHEYFKNESAKRFVIRFHDMLDDDLKNMSVDHLADNDYY